MNPYIETYNKLIGDDVDVDDPRYRSILDEMSYVIHGNKADVLKAIDWWNWNSPQELWGFVRKARSHFKKLEGR